MPRPIWSILYKRGVRTAEDLENILSPKLSQLPSPFSLDQMDLAVDRLIQAYSNGETIGLYGDYDLDGSPGLALLHKGLSELGFKDLHTVQPSRLKEGYGIHNHLVDELAAKGVSLIVTVDVGIADIEAAEYISSLGLDLVITDHHLPKETLPKALAIVNPNKGQCDSDMGHLSGTGVAFYLLCGLKSKMAEQGFDVSQFNLKKLLDLFAIATVTDMVPLVKENRSLVKHGLKVLEETEIPALGFLLKDLDLIGRPLNTQDIGFKIAPKLNALSRLEEGPRPLDVFMASVDKARAIASEVMEVNERRRQYQTEAEREVMRLIDEEGRQDDPFLLVVSESFHPGVISVVANKVMEKLGRPVFLGAIREGGKIVGSSRSAVSSLSLPDVLGFASDHLEKFGGHAMAAGFETCVDRLSGFETSLREYFTKNPIQLESGGQITHDAEVLVEDITDSLMSWQNSLEPFGQGFERPRYRLKSARIQEAKPMKGGHMRYRILSPNDPKGLVATRFGPQETLAEGAIVDFIFELQWNYWAGRRSLQLLILHHHTPSP